MKYSVSLQSKNQGVLLPVEAENEIEAIKEAYEFYKGCCESDKCGIETIKKIEIEIL